jgi:hypothetical protein
MMSGWMIIATLPNGRTQSLPVSPEVMDALPDRLQDSLRVMAGVWTDKAAAVGVLGSIPRDLQSHFEVVPVTIIRGPAC